MPQLNHGAVEAGFLVHKNVGQFVMEALRVFLTGEVAVLPAPTGDRVDHRPIIWRTVFALGLANGPRKYFETTTLVAICDQV